MVSTDFSESDCSRTIAMRFLDSPGGLDMLAYVFGTGPIRELIYEPLLRRVVFGVLFLPWTCGQFATCQDNA